MTQTIMNSFFGRTIGIARAFVVAVVLGIGVSLLASPLPALAQDWPMPNLEPADADGDGLAVLSVHDIEHYRKIFALQEEGRWREADREISQVGNPILMGHVEFQRYMHPTKYRSKFIELTTWMKQYRDHPGANRIYSLALRRKPSNYRNPPPPLKVRLDFDENDEEGEIITPDATPSRYYRSPERRSRDTRRKIANEQAHIRRHILRGQTDGALKHLTGAVMQKLFDKVEFDQIKSNIAAALFFQGENEKAFELASAAANRSREHIEIADWTAGLAAWQLGKIEISRQHFEALARSPIASNWNAAAGAYWSARTSLVVRKPQAVGDWLQRGSEYRHTFYGLLSARLLGVEIDFDWALPPLDAADEKSLKETAAVRRAIALTEAGQHHLAEREIRGIDTGSALDEINALIGLTARLGLASAGMQLAAQPALNGTRYNVASYPVPSWLPANGFSIDRALVYAFVRQESHFNARAKSRAGARGLMQLMPSTASFVARDRSLRGRNKNSLYEPDLNLELGQRYLALLMNDDKVRGNLFMIAAAYNGGPGNLSKWLRKMNHGDDPLIFLESIPSRETRFFVERILTNLWIYRHRLGQDTPSLDAVAAGHWPYYYALDNKDGAVAAATLEQVAAYAQDAD